MIRKPVGALLAALLIAGCTPTAPASPSPTPTTYLCTPEAGGTPAPCTQAQHDEMLRMNALYTDAETVLRRYVAEIDRQGSDWRMRELNVELQAVTMGEFRGILEGLIAQDRQDQANRVSAAAPIAWVKRVPGLTRGGSLVALRYCVDATVESYTTAATPTPFPGVVYVQTYYFSREADQMKISSADVQQVQSC